jgi:hypothetical protein
MDAKALRLIYSLLKNATNISEEDKRRALGIVEREIRLKKMSSIHTEEHNEKIYNEFMKDII